MIRQAGFVGCPVFIPSPTSLCPPRTHFTSGQTVTLIGPAPFKRGDILHSHRRPNNHTNLLQPYSPRLFSDTAGGWERLSIVIDPLPSPADALSHGIQQPSMTWADGLVARVSDHRPSSRLSNSPVCSDSKTPPQTPHSYQKLHFVMAQEIWIFCSRTDS